MKLGLKSNDVKSIPEIEIMLAKPIIDIIRD